MVYITGDTHGDFSRIDTFCRKFKTTKDDYMIILGDVGLNYYLNSSDKRNKHKVAKLPINLFCIQGNHECRAINLPTYTSKEVFGNTVLYETDYPNILFAQDGLIYNIPDYEGNIIKTLVIGGAYSVDKFWRLSRGQKWFEDEQPDENIKKLTEDTLESLNWKVDAVLSHTVPLKYEPIETFLPFVDQSTVDKSTEIWLDKLEDKLDYDHWYAGHYHINKKIDKLRIMMEDIDEFR